MNAPELPYNDAAYVAMWDRVVVAWRERNRFGHLRDLALSRSSIMTKAGLQKQLVYLDGFPEAQRAAIDAFKDRQAERDAEAARQARRQGQGKQAARDFMKDRREFLKTVGKRNRR